MKVTLIQTHLFWENREKNLSHFDSLITSIKEESDLIILPEMFTTGFSMNPKKIAEPSNGETLKWIKQKAKEKNTVITGSVAVEEKGNYYNRLFWVEPSGDFKTYDKRHLFRMGKEDNHYTPGTKRITETIKGWKIRPLICYDLRFPVWSRNRFKLSAGSGQLTEGSGQYSVGSGQSSVGSEQLAVGSGQYSVGSGQWAVGSGQKAVESEQRAVGSGQSSVGSEQLAVGNWEYDVLIYVANWPEVRNYPWKQLLIARAIENQCYVIGVNRIGKDGNDYSHSGDSVAINPRGEIISKTRANEESIETLNLDKSYLEEFRKIFPVGLDADNFDLKY